MDGLGQLSQSLFNKSQKFRAEAAGLQFNTFEIAVSSNAEPGEGIVLPPAKVFEKGLGPWATAEKASGSHAKATLRLVCLDRGQDTNVNVSNAAFEALIDAMRADPAALYMVCRDYDGFHAFHGAGGSLPTWFVGTSSHALLWTFDVTRARTVGVFIHRRRKLFEDFCHMLRVYAGYAHVPHLLFLAGCIHQQHHFDGETAAELNTIQRIERLTGFGPTVGQGVGGSSTGSNNLSEGLAMFRSGVAHADIDELTSWSQAVGEVSGKIANKTRHQLTSGQMLAAFKEARRAGPGAVGMSDGPVRERYEASLHKLSEALPTIEQHMATYADYLAYLRHRTERLSSVLFILLTHVDARASINLATASKRDSSSMKTVAVMTMAFLPATFFAALFAVPSLQWDQPTIIQSTFWVYWAFTLPVTVLVFSVWFGITERKWIIGKLAADGSTKDSLN